MLKQRVTDKVFTCFSEGEAEGDTVKLSHPKMEGTPLPILLLPLSFVHQYTQEEFITRLIVLRMLSPVLYALPTLSVTVMITNLQRIFLVCFNFIHKH